MFDVHSTNTPAQWWEPYGDQQPELQRFAFKVLRISSSPMI